MFVHWCYVCHYYCCRRPRKNILFIFASRMMQFLTSTALKKIIRSIPMTFLPYLRGMQWCISTQKKKHVYSTGINGIPLYVWHVYYNRVEQQYTNKRFTYALSTIGIDESLVVYCGGSPRLFIYMSHVWRDTMCVLARVHACMRLGFRSALDWLWVKENNQYVFLSLTL